MANIEFGDSEPEDGWHPDDPIPELLDNLRRRLLLLIWAGAQNNWGDREHRRARDLDEDFLFVIERVASGDG
jgi:hypothetical protein